MQQTLTTEDILFDLVSRIWFQQGNCNKTGICALLNILNWSEYRGMHVFLFTKCLFAPHCVRVQILTGHLNPIQSFWRWRGKYWTSNPKSQSHLNSSPSIHGRLCPITLNGWIEMNRLLISNPRAKAGSVHGHWWPFNWFVHPPVNG